MTRKFMKKPLVIEAFHYGFDDEPDWFNKNKHITYHPAMISKDLDTLEIKELPSFCMIQTLEGAMRADKGDYIIKGIKGEIYPCKADIFEASYEQINAPYIAKSDHLCDAVGYSTPSVLIPMSDNEELHRKHTIYREEILPLYGNDPDKVPPHLEPDYNEGWK